MATGKGQALDTTPERRNNYGPLRLALALLVLLAHSYLLTGGTEAADPLFRYTRGQLGLGGFAVNGFFLLSGCLVTQSWLRHGRTVEFARKRAARMYPGFAVAFAFSAAVAAVACGNPAAYLDHLVLGNVAVSGSVLLPDGAALDGAGAFAANPLPRIVNGSLWTLRWELACYALLAVAGALGFVESRHGVAVLLSVCLAGTVFNIVVLNDHHAHLWHFSTYFLVGAAYARYPGLPTRVVWGGAAAAAFVALGPHPPALVIAGPFLQAVMLFAAAHARPVLAPSWFARNDYSYGVYLYSFPVQQAFVLATGATHPAYVFVGALPPVLALAWLSWRLVESPALRAVKSA